MAAQFLSPEGKVIDRTPCQIYTRVMGYLRPTSAYNIGKKSEFYSRKWFTEQKASESQIIKNREFITKYGN